VQPNNKFFITITTQFDGNQIRFCVFINISISINNSFLLEGCEFHGKSKISTFNSLARPKPCWLQHQQRCGGGYRIAGKWTTLEEDRQELNAKLDEDDSDQQKNGQDLGLNELSDYFQHFVSICAPKMSDLAQSMYA
jgi:hypothetical protein